MSTDSQRTSDGAPVRRRKAVRALAALGAVVFALLAIGDIAMIVLDVLGRFDAEIPYRVLWLIVWTTLSIACARAALRTHPKRPPRRQSMLP